MKNFMKFFRRTMYPTHVRLVYIFSSTRDAAPVSPSPRMLARRLLLQSAAAAADPGSFGELPTYENVDDASDEAELFSAFGWTGYARVHSQQMWSDATEAFASAWTHANEKMTTHVTPRIAPIAVEIHANVDAAVKQYVVSNAYTPFVSAFVFYSPLLLPVWFGCVLCRRTSVHRAVFSAHAYNALIFCALLVLFWRTGDEPMASLQKTSESDYVILQLLNGTAYVAYLALQALHVAVSFAVRGSDTKSTSLGNFIVALVIGLHYFAKVFSPAMHSKPPTVSLGTYAMYTVMFGAMGFISVTASDSSRHPTRTASSHAHTSPLDRGLASADLVAVLGGPDKRS